MNNSELRDCDAPHHVRVNRRDVCYRSEIFTICDDSIEFSSGDKAQRQYMLHADAVGIVPLRSTSGNWADMESVEILLIRQYRHPLGRILWEIPAGLRDHEGEDALIAAQRELAEETDMQAEHWYRSISYLSSPGCSTENLDIYIATGVAPMPASAESAHFEREDEEREIITQWWPINAVAEAIMRRELRSPSLVLGVLAAREHLRSGDLR